MRAMELTIRPARVEDLGDYLRLRPELGVDDPEPTAKAWEQWLAPATQIAEQEGRVLGFIYFQALGELPAADELG